MDASDKRYDYDRFGSKGKRVGQAVVDFASKDQPTYTAGEILDGYSQKYCDELQTAIDNHKNKLESPFFVLVLSHKEMWAANMVRNWFISRQTPPYALELVCQYPHHMKTLYMVDAKTNDLKVCWTLPGLEDCKVILRRPQDYDPQLVTWINECFSGKLEKDSYSFNS